MRKQVARRTTTLRENLASPITQPDGSAAMNPPPDGLPTYRLLTGVDADRMLSWLCMSDSIEHVP